MAGQKNIRLEVRMCGLVCVPTESQTFSRPVPARLDLNLSISILSYDDFVCWAARVSSRTVRVFCALSLRSVRPPYGTFFLVSRAMAGGALRLYDKSAYSLQNPKFQILLSSSCVVFYLPRCLFSRLECESHHNCFCRHGSFQVFILATIL